MGLVDYKSNLMFVIKTLSGLRKDKYIISKFWFRKEKK